jgi:hypothetical protein
MQCTIQRYASNGIGRDPATEASLKAEIEKWEARVEDKKDDVLNLQKKLEAFKDARYDKAIKEADKKLNIEDANTNEVNAHYTTQKDLEVFGMSFGVSAYLTLIHLLPGGSH